MLLRVLQAVQEGMNWPQVRQLLRDRKNPAEQPVHVMAVPASVVALQRMQLEMSPPQAAQDRPLSFL